MEFKETKFSGVFEIKPRVFNDSRGYFFESFNQALFEKYVPCTTFVQDNQSFSTKNVLRGLHFQKPPYTQGKLVRVVKGKVLDVIVDLRLDSPTYGEWASFELSSTDNNMLYVAEGFAHGFVTLEDTIFTYKCTKVYNKASEGGIIWNDDELNIDWSLKDPVVSEKDQMLISFKEFEKQKIGF